VNPNELLDRVFPIFVAETLESLQQLADGVLELERASTPDAVVPLLRIAHTVKGSAASLGLVDVERTAHAVEDVLGLARGGQPLPAEAVEGVLAAVSALVDALSGDARGAVKGVGGVVAVLKTLAGGGDRRTVTPPPRPAPLPELDQLAAALGAVLGSDGAEREAHVARARSLAERLADGLEAGAAAVARRIGDAMAAMGHDSVEVARVVAKAAADVVELRSRRAPPAPVSVPVPEEASGGAAAERGEARSVRVETSRLDAVAADVDQLIVGVSARERRGRELDRMEQELREATQQLRTGLTEARIRDEARPRALSEGLDRLRQLEGAFGHHARETRRESEREAQVAHGLRGALQDLRMVPAQTALAALRPAVRDAAARLGKSVKLTVSGGDVRLDRRVLDELKAPLLHLVRNGVDHGIESPEVRAAAGKEPEALLEVKVEPRGDRVAFTVSDDGAGLSPERLRAVAVQRGLMSAIEAGRLSDAEAARIAFRPGISTASEVTALSGRGVGLDVVADAARRLGGSVDVSFERGRGTQFVLEAPLALTGTAGLLFRAAGGLALLSLDAVEAVLLVRPGDVGTIAGRPMVAVEGGQVPYSNLAQALGLGGGPPAGQATVALLVVAGGRRAAVAVDEVLGEHPMIVSPLGKRLSGVRRLAGAAVLDDGRVVSVLQPGEIVGAPAGPESGRVQARARVIVADDSLSTRAAAKAILEIAGFAVMVAADGQAALALAEEAGCDLIVSDVQMPRMDGLELTRRVKAHPKLARVPVILVTSLGSQEDRASGLKAGADGYLVKRDVGSGALLELVRRLLPE
jgi:two-component system chemotaxis sensor kinase CheA